MAKWRLEIMSYRSGRLLVLLLISMFAAASVAVRTSSLAQSGATRVNGMTPATGHPGTVVTITGDNFGGSQGSKLVAMNLGRVNLMEVRSWSNTRIQAVVPNLPVGEYTVVVYFDSTYRMSAGWTSSPRFRIVPREIGAQPEPFPRPPFLTTCTAVAKATNMLCNADFDAVGPLGSAPASVTLPSGGGAGDSAAAYWWMFINGSGPIKTFLETSDRPGATSLGGRPAKMIHVKTSNWATGILQQFLGSGTGPERVTFAVWVKVVTGKVSVSLGDLGRQRYAATTRTTGRWELLSGCNVDDPSDAERPRHMNQIFIASSKDTVAEYYVDFAEVKNADPRWTGGGCVEQH
jgi:hypothetical protein